MPTVWEQIAVNARLITLPEVYLRLKEVLDDPNYTSAKVAQVITHDPAITVRLLRIVNSAYFGLATQIDSVSRAISLLGTRGVYDLVLAVSVTQSFKGMSNEVMDMDRFWRKSVVCAITSRELSSLCNVVDSEHPFVCGLLCDIGHLFIYQHAPDKAQQAIEAAKQQQVPLYKVERTLLGIDYANVGAALMRHWQLPQNLWEPAEYHIEPEKSQDYQIFTSLVHIAKVMTEADDQNEPLESALTNVAPLAWQVTGLSTERCMDISNQVDSQVNSVMQLIFPSRKAA